MVGGVAFGSMTGRRVQRPPTPDVFRSRGDGHDSEARYDELSGLVDAAMHDALKRGGH